MVKEDNPYRKSRHTTYLASFQEFKIWQTLNNLEIRLSDTKGKKKKKVPSEPTLFDDIFTPKEELEFNGRRELTIEEKQLLAEELSVRESMTKGQVLKTLFGTSTGMDLNYEKVSGHETGAALYKAFGAMLDLSGHDPIDFTCSASEIKQQVRAVFDALGWNTDVLDIEMDISEGSRLHLQPFYNLWHLLYSLKGIVLVQVMRTCWRKYLQSLIATRTMPNYLPMFLWPVTMVTLVPRQSKTYCHT